MPIPNASISAKNLLQLYSLKVKTPFLSSEDGSK
jgi:hypothetical protein